MSPCSCAFRLVLAAVFVGVLAATPSQGADDKPPPGPYEVQIEHNVMVPMRDGVRLATDLYVPMKNGRPVADKLPAVLQRTPYDKARSAQWLAPFFASHGYLSVVQDTRGRFASEGDFFPFVDDAKDGYDTVVWLAKHPACNGKVGMFGSSARAWAQFQAASQHPPGLVTMIPDQGPINGYHYSMHTGGARHLGLLQWLLHQAGRSQEAQRDPTITKAIQTMASPDEFPRWAARLPWRRGETPLSRTPRYEEAAFKLFIEHNDYDDFWRQPGLAMDESFAAFPDIPILWVGGWYDWYPRAISDGYQQLVKLKRKNQYLLMGAWTHDNGPHDNVCGSAGDVNFGLENASLRSGDDFLQMQLRWFNHWLKDDVHADIGKPVSVFVMGGGNGKRVDGRFNHGGRWLYPDAWPPATSQAVEFYLQPKGGLAKEKPSTATAATSYTYDPRNTVSSNTRCFIGYGNGPFRTEKCRGGPHDQIEMATLPGHGMPGMPIASRPDVLVFQTPALASDITIAGNIKVVLHVSSDAPDTDFFVKLIDVHPPSADYPSGFSMPLTDGVIRARYRDGFAASKLLKADQVYRLEFPLEPSANLFKAGHRIRVDICSSNFPSFDINPNTGDPTDRRWRIANNSVWHDAKHPSCIVLPVMAPAAP